MKKSTKYLVVSDAVINLENSLFAGKKKNNSMTEP